MVDWLYEELLLAGDAVRLNGWNGIRAGSDQAKELSALLSQGLLHPGVELPADFRTPNSIQRKSYDLVSASQGYTGVPTRGGKLAGVVMEAFEADPHGMHAKAQAVRQILLSGLLPEVVDPSDPDEKISAAEGGLVERLARRGERDPKLRKSKIDSVDELACEACGFDFGKVYGDRGAGYIQVHHINPLHVTGPVETTLDDLALVCANCHAMCHRGPWIKPADVAALIAGQG